MSEVVSTKRKALEEGKGEEKKRSKLEENLSEKLTLSSLLSVGGPVANVLGRLTGWDSQEPLYNIRNPIMLIHVECTERNKSTFLRLSYSSSPEHFLVSFSNERPYLHRFVQSEENLHRRKTLTLQNILERLETCLSDFDDENGDDDSVTFSSLFSEKKTNENDHGPLGDIPEYGQDVPESTRDRFFDLARKKFGGFYFDTGQNRWGSFSWRLLRNRQQQYILDNCFSSLGVGTVQSYDETYRYFADVINQFDKLCSGEIRIMQ